MTSTMESFPAHRISGDTQATDLADGSVMITRGNPVAPAAVLKLSPDEQAELVRVLSARRASATGLAEGVEHVTAAVPGKVFYSEDQSEALILLDLDPYVVRVDSEGDTSSAYLSTIPPADIAAATGADEHEVGGFATGWEC